MHVLFCPFAVVSNSQGKPLIMSKGFSTFTSRHGNLGSCCLSRMIALRPLPFWENLKPLQHPKLNTRSVLRTFIDTATCFFTLFVSLTSQTTYCFQKGDISSLFAASLIIIYGTRILEAVVFLADDIY